MSLPNRRKVADDIDIQPFEKLGITNTRALEDLWGSKSTAAEDNALASTDLVAKKMMSSPNMAQLQNAHDGFVKFTLVRTVT